MADIEYPQRWLREAKAVTSPEGWRKEQTKELLKCQKGLDETSPPEVLPTLKTVSISGLATTVTIDETGKGEFTFNYSFVDATYEPINVTCESTTSGTGTVTNEQLDGVNGFKVSVVGGTAEDKITVKVTIDSVSSTNRTTTLKTA